MEIGVPERLLFNRNYLNIWNWLKLMNISPCFYGRNVCRDLYEDSELVGVSGCNCVRHCIARYGYDGEHRYISAQQIYEAIDTAFGLLEDFVGYPPLPTYYSTTVKYPKRTWDIRQLRGALKSVSPNHQLLSLGKPELTLLDETITWVQVGRFWEFSYITTLDPTITTFIVAHTEANRQFEDLEDWVFDDVRIDYTTNYDVDGNIVDYTVTFRGDMCQLIDPEFALTGDCCRNDADETTEVCEVTEIALYAITQDECCIGEATWRGLNGCGEACSTETKKICGSIFDHRLGYMDVSFHECCTDDTGAYILDDDGNFTRCTYCTNRLPDEIKLYYRAGLPLTSDFRTQQKLLAALVHLSASYIWCEFPHCKCYGECLEAQVRRWRDEFKIILQEGDDLSKIGNVYQLPMTSKQLDKYPFDLLTNGGVSAWKSTRNMKIGNS